MNKFAEIQTIQNPKSKIQNRKVLWLTENYPPQRGGMAVSCDRIVRSLRENNFIVDVAHFSRRYLKWKILGKVNGRHFNCPVREDFADAINRLWILVEREKYTHIAAFGGLLPMIAAPVFAKWLKIPLVTMIRGNDFDAGIFSLKRGDVLRECLNNSSAVCAVSKDKVEKILLLFPNTKTIWTPNGIDLNDWEFSAEDKKNAEKWRDEKVKENRKVLGFFGQLKRKKGGLFFLENLRRSGFADKFHLLFVGEIEEEMQNWLDENSETIHFTNLEFLDRFELLPFYAACDFVVIPSFYDGMPNVLLESAALGVPSISSNTGGMRDVLENEKTAILFDSGDEHACRKAIEKVAEIEEKEFQNLKQNCIELAKKFDHKTEAENYLKVFAETANQRSFYAEK
jgi:glycosyltransferase involved in cell wall biosynthesis